jgi:hypothetical protein
MMPEPAMLSSVLLLAMTGAHALQPPGMFHDGEAVARQGERWLALRMGEGDARLESARLRVKRVFDVIIDAEGQATGQQVESDATDVVTYLRGPGLHAGRVVRADVEVLAEAGPVAQTLQLHGQRYRIETRCRADEAVAAEPGLSSFNCSIDLIDGERVQTLVQMSATRNDGIADGRMTLGNEASPHILFAGDLDRDGKLDLLFDTSDHYNLVRPVLFLSGAAEGDELLHAVAEHRAVGC